MNHFKINSEGITAIVNCQLSILLRSLLAVTKYAYASSEASSAGSCT